jgi:uncharacterized protein
MFALQLGDSLVITITVITQIVIAYLYFRTWRFQIPPRVRNAALGVLATLWVITFFNVISELVKFRPGRWLPPTLRGLLQALGSAWGAAAAASLAIYLICRFFYRRAARDFSPSRRAALRATGAAAMTAPFVAAAFGGIIERTQYYVNEVDLPIPNLHPDLVGLRVAQVSDLHVSPFLSLRQAARVIDMTNELRPQLTFMTGDLISDFGDPLDETIREVSRLKADAGVIGCLGNHEYYIRRQAYTKREAAKYGIPFLRTEARQLRWGNGVLNVVGVDYQSTGKRAQYLEGTENLIVPGASNLLLSHNPDVFPAAVRKGFDTVISGHTHGGQVTVEILNQTLNFARFVTPYVAGMYRIDGRSCYVNAGIGTIGMPVRIGARPEITLFRLRKA